MLVVVENGSIARGEQPVSRISRDDVHLFVEQRSIQQTQIHDSRRRSKVQAIRRSESGNPFRGRYAEFVAETCAPLRRISRRLRNRANLKSARVFAANHDCKCIVETKRRLYASK